MSERSDERVGEALRSLEPHTSSPGFTGRVVEALGQRNARPLLGPGWRFAAAATAALMLAAVIFVVGRPGPGSAERSISAQADEIRLQHQQLVDELAALRELANETAPMIYLGGDEDVDLVFDLRPWVDDRRSSGMMPASYSEDSATGYYR